VAGVFFSGRRRALEALVALQRSEISDLRAAMRDERAAFAAERKDLIDRLLAVTKPAALREVHPRAERPYDPQREAAKAALPKRIFFPGYVKSFRPPTPTIPREFDVPLKREEETPS
jgi:hypothetical protein